MIDFFEILGELSYLGIFLIMVAVNAAPLLMPPSWIILSSFYAVDPSLNPIVLALVGATGATIGRFILKRISHLFRRFVGESQKSNLDIIGNFLNRRKYGYALASFLFAATPLPSNMLFVAYGLMRAKSIGLYIGFWIGRVIAYYIMISISHVVLVPFIQLFEDRFVGILIADAIGIGLVIFFTFIDWGTLLTKRKFKLTRPNIWRF
jgi:membrane protein YqaA with SNARE-associated domain